MCISKTYLESSFPNDERLNLPDYNVVRADNPIHTKRRCVCVYIKESFAVCSVTSPFLKECFLSETFIQNRKGHVFSLCRLPSQTQD